MMWRRITGWPASGVTSPFDEFDRLRREVDWLTDRVFGGQAKEPFVGVFPLINMSEDKDNFYVRAELPGMKADEIEISVTGNTLSISGERKIAPQPEGVQYHRRERDAGTFSRIVSLPSQLNTAGVEARCADGILTVVLPKAEAAKPRQITVRS